MIQPEKNDIMKPCFLRVYIPFALLLMLFPQIALKAQTDLSEGWEIRATERQPPEKVMASIGLKEGMVIGEIGAGRGRYTVYLSRKVGPGGKIYANDIDKQALSYLEERCRRLGFKNVTTILGEEEDPLFPANSLDMAIMVWVYHMIEQPDNLLRNLLPALKPGARLVILDPVDSEIDAEFGIDRCVPDIKVPTIKERIEASAREAGYELERVETFLKLDYIFVLRPVK